MLTDMHGDCFAYEYQRGDPEPADRHTGGAFLDHAAHRLHVHIASNDTTQANSIVRSLGSYITALPPTLLTATPHLRTLWDRYQMYVI